MGLTTGNASPGGVPIPPCGMTPGGDGVLLSNGAGISVVEIGPGDSLDGGLMQFDGIIGAVRNDGCVNQVLEAGLHALAPSALDLDIPAHAAFHGDRENAALFRPGDLVVVVFATLVDDCSWNETVVSGAWTPCPGGVGDWCCDAALYPASRYADAYRRAADALGVELAMVVLGAVPTADVSLAEWRAAGDPSTECEVYNPVYRSAPWRLLEVADALEPFASTQPACYDAVLSAPGIDDALRGHTCR